MYESDGTRHDPIRVFETRQRQEPLPPTVQSFAKTLLEGIVAKREEIDHNIVTYAPSWPLDQIAVIDRNILRVAIYEIVMEGETPPKVAINEAVELGKIFGSDNSPKFVNGVLGSLMAVVEGKT